MSYRWKSVRKMHAIYGWQFPRNYKVIINVFSRHTVTKNAFGLATEFIVLVDTTRDALHSPLSTHKLVSSVTVPLTVLVSWQTDSYDSYNFIGQHVTTEGHSGLRVRHPSGAYDQIVRHLQSFIWGALWTMRRVCSLQFMLDLVSAVILRFEILPPYPYPLGALWSSYPQALGSLSVSSRISGLLWTLESSSKLGF
jgi:hypothetical protein